MAAAIQGRNTARRERGLINAPVAANTLVRIGLIACVNTDGYVVEGSTATGLIYLGRFEETVDNTGGANGEVSVLIREGEAFLFENSAADPVLQQSFGAPCFIEDNQTVAATDGAGTRSKSGRVVGVESDGVWVQ